MTRPSPARRTAPHPAVAALGEGALAALLDLKAGIAGWMEGAKENHEALGHRGEYVGDECWTRFSEGDIVAMLGDTARNLGIEQEWKARTTAPIRPDRIHTCIRHRALEGTCQADTQSDPCKVIDLEIGEYALTIVRERRDALMARADDAGEWTDPDTGRRYLAALLAARIEQHQVDGVYQGVSVVMPSGTGWGYIAGELLDIHVPGYTDTATVTQTAENTAILTWK